MSFYLLFKNIVDRVFALFFIISLSPVLVLVALVVRIALGRGVLFTQQRPGLHCKPFFIYKFRTMINSRDCKGDLLPDECRLTPIGNFLRSSSIDELPALVNILLGEMSFIGPRPLLMKYLPLYTPQQQRRHAVKPGLSGWAQVNGRNTISWEEKFCLDIWYVDNQSFCLDLRILLLTIWKVIRREGISAVGEATMPPFSGTDASE